MFNLCSGKTVGCGRWRKASVKLLCIIIGTGRFGVSSPVVNADNAPPVRASSRVRPWTRVHSFLLHAQCLYYAFSLKSALRHPPQPPFLHTSPNSGQSSFPLLHLSGLVRLSAASLKGCTTTLLSIIIHVRGFAPSHEYSASATPSVRQ